MSFLAFASIQLIPDGTLFIHIALILIMIWVLNRTLFKPINAILEKRSKQKVGKGGEAAGILKNVEEKRKKHEAEMLKIRSESYDFIEKGRAEAVEERQTTISNAKESAIQRLTKEKDELRDHVASAKVQIALEAEKMAEKISDNILKA